MAYEMRISDWSSDVCSSDVPGVSHLYPYNVNNRYPFNQELIARQHVGQSQSFHCVNLAQGIKSPLIYYQQNPDSVYLKAVKKAFDDIRIFHGQAQGMYGGDEAMHGNVPDRKSTRLNS